MTEAVAWSAEVAEKGETLRLVRQARGGDLEAFDLLIRRHERRVLKVAYQMVGNPDDAQDVAQEAFIRLWKYLARIRDEARFSTWLYRLVVNASYDLLNRRRGGLDPVPLENADGTAIDPADEEAVPLERAMVARDLKEKVLAVLDRLTPSERTVFVLRDLEGLEVNEIAAIQEISAVTVRRHLSTARHKLRARLAELGQVRGPKGE